MRGGIKGKIVRMNLLVIVPILILLSTTALTTIYTQLRKSSIKLLTSESYNSQIYIMEQLTHMEQLAGGGTAVPEAMLQDMAPVICRSLSDSIKMRVQLFDRQGRVIGDSSLTQSIAPTEDVTLAAAGTKAYTFVTYQHSPYISFSSPIYGGEEAIGAVRYIRPQEDMELVVNLGLVLVGFIVIATVVSLVVSGFMAGGIARPVTALKTAINELEQEGAHPPLEAMGGSGELRELELAFESMKERNDRYIQRLNAEREKQNLFFNSATHQLKTPLTSIIGYSEIIRRMSSDEDVTMSADYIEKAGRNLLEVVENIINISRFKRTDYEFDPTWFHLEELCEECVTLLRPRVERSGMEITCRCQPLELYFDRQRTREVILNILDNCILYSGGSSITISSDTHPLRLYIRDNGTGIGKEQLGRLFEPFYRPSTATHGGSGLGLSICKSIMVAQGGDVTVDSDPGQGTCVTLAFGKPMPPAKEQRRI